MNYFNNKKLKKFRLKGIKINRKKLYFGSYGLVSLETSRVSSQVSKSLIDIVKRKIKSKKGKFWFYLNNSVPVSQIPIGTRMGKGKGNVSKHVAFVRQGQTVCELNLNNSKDAFHILKIASSKLPIKTKIVVY